MSFYIEFALIMLIPMCLQYVKGYKLSYKSAKSISLFLSAILLLLVTGFRSVYVGADTRQYASAFLQLQELSVKDALTVPIRSWHGIFTYSLESGYIIYNKFVGLLGDSYQLIIFFNSLLIAILLYKLIKKNSPYYMLSIWLYITLGFFQTEMNLARNAIAILICLNATTYIKEHKLVKYLVIVLIAASFHTTALIFAPLYWVINYVELTPKRLKIFIALAFVVGLFGKSVYQFLVRVAPSRYTRYLVLASSVTEGIYLLFLFLGIFVFILLFCDNKRDAYFVVGLDNTGAWLFILMILSFTLSRSINAFTRVAAIFSPYLIVYFPEMISYGVSNRRNRIIIILSIVIGAFAAYILRLNFNNIGSTMPYAFYWEKIQY